MRVPVELETAVRDAARAVLGDASLATSPLVRAIVDRSRRYTSERDQLATPRDPDGDLAARAVFFTLADAPKLALPLAELGRRDALPRGPLRVLDVGAGCGAMSLGLLAALPDRTVTITAIDRDARALDIARRAIERFGLGRVTLATRVTDATRAELPPADLVVIGTVLNELTPDAALAVVDRAFAATAEAGAVIAIEPALRETSRALHAIRDAMIARGAHVFAPCTRRCVPCTALADPDDWCHEDRALELPPATRELARLTHLRDGGMKFAYLVLRKQPLDLVDAGPTAWRVVSAPFVEKGKREVHACSEHGRQVLRLLKRNRGDHNRAFERAERGDVIVTADVADAKRVELAGELRVERVLE